MTDCNCEEIRLIGAGEDHLWAAMDSLWKIDEDGLADKLAAIHDTMETLRRNLR